MSISILFPETVDKNIQKLPAMTGYLNLVPFIFSLVPMQLVQKLIDNIEVSQFDPFIVVEFDFLG